jgi:hypothetical protein
LSWYIDNLNRSIAEHERIIEARLPESAQAQQIIDQHRAEIERVRNSAPPSSPQYSGSSPWSPPPPPPPKPPDPWIRNIQYTGPEGIKQAEPDIVLFNDEVISPELLLQLQYEDISGIELINITRSDIIDGQNVVYSPISQLSALRRKYNPNNIIALDSSSSDFFARYGIDLILRGIREPYFDSQGNLIIEIDQVFDDEIIEAEIDLNGTINTVDYS